MTSREHRGFSQRLCGPKRSPRLLVVRGVSEERTVRTAWDEFEHSSQLRNMELRRSDENGMRRFPLEPSSDIAHILEVGRPFLPHQTHKNSAPSDSFPMVPKACRSQIRFVRSAELSIDEASCRNYFWRSALLSFSPLATDRRMATKTARFVGVRHARHGQAPNKRDIESAPGRASLRRSLVEVMKLGSFRVTSFCS